MKRLSDEELSEVQGLALEMGPCQASLWHMNRIQIELLQRILEQGKP